MTSSQLTRAAAAAEQEEFDAAIEAVVLPDAAITSLSPSQIENMRTNVVIANQGMATAGNAIKASAAALHDIKVDVKNKNWTALTDSGALDMSGRAARDLVGAYESWLSTTDIPDSALVKVTARMLFKIGKAEPGKRVHAINKIKKGDGFTEGDLAKIIGKTKSPIRRQIDDLMDQEAMKAKKTPDADKIAKFAGITLENIKLKSQVSDLQKKLADAEAPYKAQIKSLKSANSKLTQLCTEASKSLIEWENKAKVAGKVAV